MREQFEETGICVKTISLHKRDAIAESFLDSKSRGYKFAYISVCKVSRAAVNFVVPIGNYSEFIHSMRWFPDYGTFYGSLHSLLYPIIQCWDFSEE